MLSTSAASVRYVFYNISLLQCFRRAALQSAIFKSGKFEGRSCYLAHLQCRHASSLQEPFPWYDECGCYWLLYGRSVGVSCNSHIKYCDNLWQLLAVHLYFLVLKKNTVCCTFVFIIFRPIGNHFIDKNLKHNFKNLPETNHDHFAARLL